MKPRVLDYVYLVSLMVWVAFLGSLNSVIFKIVCNVWGQQGAFFLDNGNNVFYVLFSGVIVLYLKQYTNVLTPEQRKFPQYKFFIMAAVDALGQFLSFIGAVYTPGQDQQLLNQCLIPTTMISAGIILGSRYRPGEYLGASIVLIGAALSLVPKFGTSDDESSFRWWAIIVYFCSNIPMSFSAVYKEYAFHEDDLDPYYLTYWVSWYQMFLTLPFAVLQGIPGLGSPQGISQAEIWGDLWQGTRCFFDLNEYTATGALCLSSAFLLFLYSCTNFIYNVSGLYLTKAGMNNGTGAVLCSIAYAVKVPAANILFTFPILMGKYVEKFSFWSVLGLIVVTSGFLIYIYFTSITAITAEASEEEMIPLIPSPQSPKRETSVRLPWGFHDRVVGVQATGTVSPAGEITDACFIP